MSNHPLLQDYLTASGKYPERAKSKELTPELIDNANILLSKVQDLFLSIGLKLEDYKFSSGFRPTDVNANIKNAAKKSLHSRCMAMDIEDDKKQSLGKKMQLCADKRLLEGIWLESPVATKGKFTNWVHLDLSKTRIKRNSMEFMP